MKTAPLVLLLISASLSFAQTFTFAPVGAEWWYSTGEIANTNTAFHFICIGDTVIEGKNCRIIHADLFPNSVDPEQNIFVYQVGDAVYRYFSEEDRFLLLYDFSLNAGDTYFAHVPDFYDPGIADSFLVHITMVDTIEINGYDLRRQSITCDGYYDWFMEHIEVIGNTFMLFPFYDLVEVPQGPLRCYTDDQIGHYETGVVADCAGSYTSVQDPQSTTASVFCDQHSKTLHISGIALEQIGSILTYDAQGRELCITMKADLTADVSNLPPGYYFTIIKSSDVYMTYPWVRY